MKKEYRSALPNEIKLIRFYDAPVKTVWEAWNDVKQVAQWWGPRGFTITTNTKDVRTGGTWDYTMHSSDVKNIPNFTKYLEVEPLKRMVYDHGTNKDSPPMFRVTTDFSEVDGGTEVEITMAFPTVEVAEKMGFYIKKAGGDTNWDRLAEYLDEQKGKKRFYINRSFKVGVEKMCEMWTNPEKLSQWLPPTGLSMKVSRADIRAGGQLWYSMTDGEIMTMYGRAQYLEIEKPHHLKYTQQFCDEKGNVSRHPFAPQWPETMLTTVTFSKEGSNQTRVTVCWEPTGKVAPEEMDVFIQGRAGMSQGWTGSFDKLEAVLGR